MRFLLSLGICLICASVQAQDFRSEIEVHTTYMPDFTVQQASDRNVQAAGLRWMISDHDWSPAEFGLHAHIGYGDVARASIGASIAYLFARPGAQNFKLGVSFSKIDLEDVNQNKNGIGPNVGDVRYIDAGTGIQPYIEWQWDFSRFSSLSVQTGYRIINAEKSVVTAVEPTDDPIVDRRVADRRRTFFYSASGFEIGIGLSVNLY